MRLPRLALRRVLAVAVVAAAALSVAAPPASAATGPGRAAGAWFWVADFDDALGRAGNAYSIDVSVDVNPEGLYLDGRIWSYDCEPGQPVDHLCERVAQHRLVPAGPAVVTVRNDGRAQITATVAEVRVRDGRQLRVFDVDLAIAEGTLQGRRNCLCSWNDSNGNTWIQQTWLRDWVNATPSGTVGPFAVPVTDDPRTSARSVRYQVKSSEPFQP